MTDQEKLQDELFDEQKESFLIFTLDNSRQALHSSQVKKVQPNLPITFIPGCPDYVLGIIHIRGDIEAVINLRTIVSVNQLVVDAGFNPYYLTCFSRALSSF